MSDARKTVLNTEVWSPTRTRKIDASTITYDKTLSGGSSGVGKAVTLSTDDTVALCADGEFFLGVLELVEADGFCTVREHGCVTAPAGTGASLTLGKKVVGALLSSAKGYVREVATATAAELGIARGFITNNDVTTAVVIELE